MVGFTPKIIGASRCWILGSNYTKRLFVSLIMTFPLTHKITERTIYLRFDTFIATHKMQYLTLGSYLPQIYCNVSQYAVLVMFASQHWCQLAPPMHGQYNLSYSIIFNYNIARPLPTPFRNIVNKNLFYVCFCVPPNSMIYIHLWFFKMQIFRIHMNSWFILHRSVKVALKLVQISIFKSCCKTIIQWLLRATISLQNSLLR